MTGAAGVGPAGPELTDFTRAWADAVTGTSYLPMTRSELEAFLLDITRRLLEVLAALDADGDAGGPDRGAAGNVTGVGGPRDAGPLYRIGAELVAAHLNTAEALGRTITAVGLHLPSVLGDTGDDMRSRMSRLLGGLATGYAQAIRARVFDQQETIQRAALVAREQAEQALRDSEARFRHQATHDPLTGLPNRALFTERLERLFDRPRRAGRRLGLCFLDLDGFKVVNDTLGHHIGDMLLTQVADRLRHATTGTLLARLGGDEFVVLLEDSTCTDEAVKVADASIAALAEPFAVGGHEVTVSASVGIVERPVLGDSPAEVMRAADITLHWAKAAGKNRWALFDPERNERELARYTLSTAMPAALGRGEFFLDYQPLVSLSTGAVLGAEALVRWRHPQLGVLRPDKFIGLAEETGLIVRLGAQLLSDACQQASRWYERDPGCPFVSVNLAVRQAHDPSLVGMVCEVLERAELPPDKLQLEITESAVMDNADEPLSALRTLADLGVRIAIDDFGTGYSNLAYLRQLPVCELKVAGSFVAGLPPAPGDPAGGTDEQIIVTLVSLARALGLTTTAEGVETAAQAERLRAIGCDAAQGWHFGRPGPPYRIVPAGVVRPGEAR